MPKREAPNTVGVYAGLCNNAVRYLSINDDEKKLKEEKEVLRTEILSAIPQVNYEEVGQGKVVTISLPELDKQNIQVSDTTVRSITVVSNAIQVLRGILGKKLDDYIVLTESLHPTALDTLVTNGLITPDQFKDLISITESSRLNVKRVKK